MIFSYLPFIPLGVEYGSSVTTLPESDEGTSDAVILPLNTSFPFSDSLQTKFFVSGIHMYWVVPYCFNTGWYKRLDLISNCIQQLCHSEVSGLSIFSLPRSSILG